MKEREDVPQILSSRKTRIKTPFPQPSPQVKKTPETTPQKKTQKDFFQSIKKRYRIYPSDTILQKNKD